MKLVAFLQTTDGVREWDLDYFKDPKIEKNEGTLLS